MRKILITTLTIVALVCCTTHKSISHKGIKYREINGESFWYYKNKQLEGTYKVKGRTANDYSIRSYINGKLDGNFISYEKIIKTEEREYEKGLLNGTITTYSNGSISEKCVYRNGFPNGSMLKLNQNGDTILYKQYASNPNEMNIYVNSIDDISYEERTTIYKLVDPCLVKSDLYPQRFYLRKDSSLIFENIWERIDDCYHQLRK